MKEDIQNDLDLVQKKAEHDDLDERMTSLMKDANLSSNVFIEVTKDYTYIIVS